MYGSAGTYSAGSTASSGLVFQASAGIGVGANEPVPRYEFTVEEVGIGLTASDLPWGIFTSTNPASLGVAAEDGVITIGTIEATASVGVGIGGGEYSPKYTFTIDPPGLGVSAGENTYKIIATAESAALGLGIDVGSVIGTLTVTVEEVSLGLGVETPERSIVLEGIPKFTVTPVSGNFQIDIQNRDGKAVKIYRTDQHNTSAKTEIEITADIYNDPIVSGKNYRYKLAFFIDLTPQVIGQKSIYKFGKS